MEEVCELCGVLRLEASAGQVDDERRNAYKEALKKLLVLMQKQETQIALVGQQCDILAQVVVVAAAHAGTHYWTDDINRQLANELLTALYLACKESSCQNMLMVKTELLAAIFSHLKNTLTKESWKHFPVQKQALVWIVQHVKHPNLGPHFPSFLPPVLWMLEDDSDYHRTVALSTITHILHNMDPTALRWHGRAELLYQALKPLLYISSSEVVCALHPCLLKLLSVMEYSPLVPTIPAQPKIADEMFSVLLSALAKESKISLRRAYTAQLRGYILHLGIFSVRHIKLLLPLLLSALEFSDPDREMLRWHSLQALSTLICCTWPRSSTHKYAILKALSALVQDLTSGNPADAGILDLVVECLTLIMVAAPELKDEYKWLGKSCHHSIMQSCLQQALDNGAT